MFLFLKLKHVRKTQEQMMAAEKREAEMQKERLERQQQNVQEKLQLQKQKILKQQVGAVSLNSLLCRLSLCSRFCPLCVNCWLLFP